MLFSNRKKFTTEFGHAIYFKMVKVVSDYIWNSYDQLKVRIPEWPLLHK